MRWPLVVLLVAACRPPGVEPCSGSGSTGGGGITSSLERVVLTGQRQTMHFEAFLMGCVQSVDVQVTAKVYDADNVEVASTVDNVVVQSLTAAADVHFTPVAPGNHHLTVRFEPNLGIQQSDLLVAADRRADQGAAVQLPSGVSCDAVTLMPSTAVLCLRAARSELSVYRGGASAQLIPSVSAYAVAGDVVWTGGVTLTRWEDRGAGALAKSGSLAGVPGALLRVLPGGDVLEISPGHVYRSGFDGGALVQPYAAVETSFDGPVALSPGGTRVLGVGVRGACVSTVPGNGAPSFGCEDVQGTPLTAVGSDHGGVWASSFGSAEDLFYFPVTDSLSVDGGAVPPRRLRLPQGWDARAAGADGRVEALVPLLRPVGSAVSPEAASSALPIARGGDLLLEQFAPAGGTASGDDRQVLVTLADGTMRVVPRGP